jgi:hypothetical protein
MPEDAMIPPRPSARRAARFGAAGPCIDRFGACTSIVVVAAALVAAFIVRQNLHDHVYQLATNAGPAQIAASR